MEQPVNLSSPPASFGALLRARRHRAFLSQEQLAAHAGLSERTVRNLEAGRVQAPRTSTIRLLADALQLSEPDRESWLEAARGGLPDQAVQAPAGQPGWNAGILYHIRPASANGPELHRESRWLREAAGILQRAVAIFAAAVPRPLRAGG